MTEWCGTTDVRSLLLGGLFILLSPLITLYFIGLYAYCRLAGKIFLEAEQKQSLEKAIEKGIKDEHIEGTKAQQRAKAVGIISEYYLRG